MLIQQHQETQPNLTWITPGNKAGYTITECAW